MALRSLKHEIVNEVDINQLLRKFTVTELAYIFRVDETYIYKARNLQKIQAEAKFEKNIYSDSDELKLGRVGAWSLSAERKTMQEIKGIINEQNKEI